MLLFNLWQHKVRVQVFALLREPLNNCHFEHGEKSILLIAKDSSLRSE